MPVILRMLQAAKSLFSTVKTLRVQVNGRTQIVQTQVRAPNSADARWLLWAQFGFHSITSGPNQVKA